MKKYVLFTSLVLALAILAVACQPAAPQVVKETVIVGGTPQVVEKVVTPTPAKAKRANVIRTAFLSGDVPTLDPSVSEDTSSITIVEDTFVGLTRLNETTSALEPGMASKWDISADGRVYTFTLLGNIPWVKYDGAKKQVVKVQTCPDKDGKTKDRLVTAKDFEYGILRALSPKTASPYAYVLAFVIQGADDYNSGTITDTAKVGVKAVNDTTLVVRFKEDAAYNANIIGLWTAMPVPKWIVEGDDCTEKRGDKWIEPGFFQSFGPFTLKEWIHDSSITIVKNPFWPGSPSVPQAKVDEVTWAMIDGGPQLAEYEAGRLDMADEFPSADLDRIKADPKLSKELNISPSLCTYFYGFNTKAKGVDDARVRRALSMAIDRAGLIKNVTKGDQEPAQWFARPGLAAAPTMKDYPNLGIKFDVAKAKAELDAYLKEKNLTADKLEISVMFNTSTGHQRIAEYIQQQWKTNLGLNVKLTNQEWKVFLETIKSKDTPQIWRLGWCLDYPDANNFDNEVFAVGGSSNPAEKGEPYGGINWKNPKYEDLVKKAAIEKDPKKRVDMYAQVEQILVYDDAAIIPIYWYTDLALTKPYIKRTYSVGGHQRYEKWEVLQD